ncbi:hypothetical protein DFH06DRAFT_1151755 [Mycena polygramma]|nr:hypothetical protein DFH06DRAFT_1151755 [Mycena polygramma]
MCTIIIKPNEVSVELRISVLGRHSNQSSCESILEESEGSGIQGSDRPESENTKDTRYPAVVAEGLIDTPVPARDTTTQMKTRNSGCASGVSTSYEAWRMRRNRKVLVVVRRTPIRNVVIDA